MAFFSPIPSSNPRPLPAWTYLSTCTMLQRICVFRGPCLAFCPSCHGWRMCAKFDTPEAGGCQMEPAAPQLQDDRNSQKAPRTGARTGECQQQSRCSDILFLITPPPQRGRHRNAKSIDKPATSVNTANESLANSSSVATSAG